MVRAHPSDTGRPRIDATVTYVLHRLISGAAHLRRAHPWRAMSAVILVIVAACFAQVALATAPTGGGWDVSWPQCIGTSTQSLPSLPSLPVLGIVGINDGRPFTSNPCLAAQFQWAQSQSPANAELYVNADDPGPKSAYWPALKATAAGKSCPSSGSRNTASCAFVYGWNAAKDAVVRFTSVFRPTTAPAPSTLRFWLDVEAANSWQTSSSLNTASIDGTVAYLQSQHALSVGIYANRSDSHAIFTATSVFPNGTLTWLATGATTLTGGLAFCGYPGFGVWNNPASPPATVSSGTATLVQWWPHSPQLDADATCVGTVTGNANITAGRTASGLALHLTQPATQELTFTISGITGSQFTTAGQPTPRSTATVVVPAGSSTSSSFTFTSTVAGYRDIIATCAAASPQCGPNEIATYAYVAPGPAYCAPPPAVPSTPPPPPCLGIGLSTTTVPVFGHLAANVYAFDIYRNPTGAPSVRWSVNAPLIASVPPGPATAESVTGQAVGTTTLIVAAPGYGVATSTINVVAPVGRGAGLIQGGGGRVAGLPSTAMTTRVWAPVAVQPRAFSLHSSNRTGRFSLSPNGPWSSTLLVSIPVGQVVSTPWYSRERVAGTTVLTAVSGSTTITRSVGVVPAAPVRLVILPRPLRMTTAHPERLQAFLRDPFGNLTRAVAVWTKPVGGRIRLQRLRAWNPLVIGAHRGVTRITARLHAFTASGVVIVTS